MPYCVDPSRTPDLGSITPHGDGWRVAVPCHNHSHFTVPAQPFNNGFLTCPRCGTEYRVNWRRRSIHYIISDKRRAA